MLEFDACGPLLAILKLELVLGDQSSDDQLQFMTRKPASGTSVSAGSKVHLLLVHAGELILEGVSWRGLAKVVEA